MGSQSTVAPSPLSEEAGADELISVIGRAAAYRLLAAAYGFPGESELPVKEAIVAFDNAHDKTLVELVRAVGRAAEGSAASLSAAYEQLIGFGTGGDLSLYETEHVGVEIFKKSRDLADIAGFYHAFGMEVDPTARERVDHISVEAEFLGWLCAKQVASHSEGHTEQAAVCRDAEFRFLRDHFLRWVPCLAGRLAERSEGFYRALAHLTAAFSESLGELSKEVR